MNCTQGASNDLNKGIVNLIFDEVKILVNKPLEFSFGCNKVLSFDCEEIGVGTTKAIFNFDSKEGSVEFVFLAQSLEVEYLNPYLIFDSSEFE